MDDIIMTKTAKTERRQEKLSLSKKIGYGTIEFSSIGSIKAILSEICIY